MPFQFDDPQYREQKHCITARILILICIADMDKAYILLQTAAIKKTANLFNMVSI